MKLFNFLKRKKEIDIPVINTEKEEIKQEVQEPKSLYETFCCHYCGKEIEIIPSKIFPISVPKLYSNYFFQGKGYHCSYCGKDCVIG